MVPAPGLEPGRPKATDFKSDMSTVPPRGLLWCAWRDSNPRPSRYERPALTAELQARVPFIAKTERRKRAKGQFAPQHFLYFRPDPPGQGRRAGTGLSGGFSPGRFEQEEMPKSASKATKIYVVNCRQLIGPLPGFRSYPSAFADR